MKNSHLPLFSILPVADYVVKINTNAISLIDYLKRQYLNRGDAIIEKNAILSFEISEDKTKQYYFKCPQINFSIRIHRKTEEQQNWCVIEAIKIISQYFFLSKGILFLHASAIIYNNNAYVFSGFAGSGKTTISNKVASENKIADDQVVLKKVKNKYFVYSSVFDIKLKKPNYQGILLKKIFLIVQSKVTIAKPITNINIIISFLIKNDLFNAAFEFYLNQNKEESQLHFEIASKLLNSRFKNKQLQLYLKLCKRLQFHELCFSKNISRDKFHTMISDHLAK